MQFSIEAEVETELKERMKKGTDMNKIVNKALKHYFRKSTSKYHEIPATKISGVESLFGLLRKKNEKKKQITQLIEDFLKNYLTSASQSVFQNHQKIIEDLSNAQLISIHGVNRSKKLKDKLQKNASTPVLILIKAVKCIYQVRNDPIHNGEIHSDLLKGSSSLLADIIRKVTRAYVTTCT